MSPRIALILAAYQALASSRPQGKGESSVSTTKPEVVPYLGNNRCSSGMTPAPGISPQKINPVKVTSTTGPSILEITNAPVVLDSGTNKFLENETVPPTLLLQEVENESTSTIGPMMGPPPPHGGSIMGVSLGQGGVMVGPPPLQGGSMVVG